MFVKAGLRDRRGGVRGTGRRGSTSLFELLIRHAVGRVAVLCTVAFLVCLLVGDEAGQSDRTYRDSQGRVFYDP